MATVVLWVDTNAESSTNFRGKLLAYRWVKIFTKADGCIDYIKSHLTQYIFLIISGTLAENVVPQVAQYVNVKQIFIFCASIASHLEWAMNYIDRLLMFDHEDDLLERLWKEMEQHYREQAQECIQQADEANERSKQYKHTPCG